MKGRRSAKMKKLSLRTASSLEAFLVQRYGAIDRDAYAFLRKHLPAAIKAGKLEPMLKALGKHLAKKHPDSTIAATAEKAAKKQNESLRKRTFAVMGAVLGARVLGTDEPGSPIHHLAVEAVEEITKTKPKKESAKGKPNEMPTALKKKVPEKRDPGLVLRKGERGGRGSAPRVRGRPTIVPRVSFRPEILTEAFVKQNVVHISTLRKGLLNGIRDAVIREAETANPDTLANVMLRSWRAKGVPSNIPIKRKNKTITVSARRHAKMIAQDQLARLASQLGQVRRGAMGIEKFRWQTMEDSQVRPSHSARNGRTFDSDKGDDGVYPGDEVACRCWSVDEIEKKDLLKKSGAWIQVSGTYLHPNIPYVVD